MHNFQTLGSYVVTTHDNLASFSLATDLLPFPEFSRHVYNLLQKFLINSLYEVPVMCSVFHSFLFSRTDKLGLTIFHQKRVYAEICFRQNIAFNCFRYCTKVHQLLFELHCRGVATKKT